MARLPRAELPGETHVALQRLRPERAALLADEDARGHYLAVLRELLPASGVQLYAYALWPDRAWLLLAPREAGAVGRLVQAHGRRFVAWANHRFGWTGGLWQGRFALSPVEPAWVLRAMRYIETGLFPGGVPPEGGLARSSYAHHAGLARDPWLATPPAYWDLGNTPFDREAAYRAWCAEGMAPAEMQRLAYAAAHGWALGGEAYVEAMAEAVDRPLAPRRRGRPRKSVS